MNVAGRLSFVIKSIFNRPVEKIIYHLCGVFPRDRRLWVIGAQKESFSCNPKYFFIETSLDPDLDVRCVWISRSETVVRKIRAMGLEAEVFPSLKAFYLCVRAGCYFVNCSAKDISFNLSKNAFYVNFWHGIPLKNIQGVKNNSLSRAGGKYGGARLLFNKVFNPREVFSYDRVLSPSRYVVDYSFSSAFDLPAECFLLSGYPRNDIFLKSGLELDRHIEKYDEDLLPILEWVKDKGKVFMYMPTWRDTDEDFVKLSGIDFDDLNSRLARLGACLLLKMHPNTKIDLSRLSGMSNILVVESKSDVYPLMNYVDFLITDYSSIYFDFLLLDRPIIFFCFDMESYLDSCRDLYFDYDDVSPGVKAYSYEELCRALEMVDRDDWAFERERVRTLFWEGTPRKVSHVLAEQVKRAIEDQS